MSPTRKNIRFEYHDYSGGLYFVTLCTKDKNHYFGKINQSEGQNIMYLSELGTYCNDELHNIGKHYPYAKVLLHQVMPNHIHALIEIKERTHEPCVPTIRSGLSVIVGGFKRSVTMFARRNNIPFGWHSRYNDHIVRDNGDLNNIS